MLWQLVDKLLLDGAIRRYGHDCKNPGARGELVVYSAIEVGGANGTAQSSMTVVGREKASDHKTLKSLAR